MKLSQRHHAIQSDRLQESDSFNRRLQRQRIGFGLLTPGFGLPPDGNDVSCCNRLQNTRAGLEIVSCETLASKRTSVVGDMVHKAVTFATQSWRVVHARQQQRKAIYNLLSSSDHYLDDIGLDRAELELLLHTNESLEQLVRTRRDEKDRDTSHVTGIGISETSPDDRGYTEFGFDRAA